MFLLSRFFGGVPLVDQRLDVALEDFGQVVVTVEFVFIGDTGKGLDGGVNGHGGRKDELGRLKDEGLLELLSDGFEEGCAIEGGSRVWAEDEVFAQPPGIGVLLGIT